MGNTRKMLKTDQVAIFLLGTKIFKNIIREQCRHDFVGPVDLFNSMHDDCMVCASVESSIE